MAHSAECMCAQLSGLPLALLQLCASAAAIDVGRGCIMMHTTLVAWQYAASSHSMIPEIDGKFMRK